MCYGRCFMLTYIFVLMIFYGLVMFASELLADAFCSIRFPCIKECVIKLYIYNIYKHCFYMYAIDMYIYWFELIGLGSSEWMDGYDGLLWIGSVGLGGRACCARIYARRLGVKEEGEGGKWTRERVRRDRGAKRRAVC